MTPEEIAMRVATALLTNAVGRAATTLADRVRGSARERAFRAAVRAAVVRLAQQYPTLSAVSAQDTYFGDPEVVSLIFALVLEDDGQALPELARRFRTTYDDRAIFGSAAEDALRELVDLLEDELSAASILAHQRDRKHFRRIEEQLADVMRAVGSGPLTPAGALAAVRDIHDRLQLSPLGSTFATQIVVDEDVARLSLHLRPGIDLVGRMVFVFPDDDAGRAVSEELRQAIETGTEASIPRKYITAFEATANGNPLPWTDSLPAVVTVLASPPNPFASRLSLYRSGRLLAAVDVPHLRRVRGGTKEAFFKTEPGRALELSLTINAPPIARVHQELEFDFAKVRDAREGWPLMQFLLCAPEADRLVWERLETGERLTLHTDGVPRAPTISARYLAHLKALWHVETATGVTMTWPAAGVAHADARRALRVARAVRTGVRASLFRAFDIELDRPADTISILADANDIGEVSLNILEPHHHAVVGGQRLDLGPTFHWFPTVRIASHGNVLRVEPGTDRRSFQVFVAYSEDFEVTSPSTTRKVVFSAPKSFPLVMLGLRRRQSRRWSPQEPPDAGTS